MYITPKAGLVVRNPATGEILPETGADIPPGPHKSYWLRRQLDGDVIISLTAPVQPATAQPAKSKTSSTEEGN